MKLIHKAFLFFREEGLKKTLRRTVEKCCEFVAHFPNTVREKKDIQHYIDHIRQKADNKNVYIIISCIDWHIPLFQRPHQMAIALSKREDAYVLFVSDEYRYDNFPGIQPITDDLDLVSYRIVNQIDKALIGAREKTVFMSWPRQAHLLDCLSYDKLIYECIDDISLFYYYSSEMIERHLSLIREADLTVCTARALYEQALPIAKKLLLSPNAGDYTFFHDNKGCPIEPALLPQIRNYSCVLGYYGCLASWFDYDLIIEIAERMPDWCFVLVGYSFDGTAERLHNSKLKNIFVYPAQEYRRLPQFVSGFDILTIPFVINNITTATSPVKLFEYMASGKPILTSALPECKQYRSVTIYEDADDFIEKVRLLLNLRNDPSYCETMEKEAQENTWDYRVADILKCLMES